MKTMFITGSSGYVGNVLVQHFIKKKWHVIGFDLTRHHKQKNLDNFTFYKGDIRDKKKLGEVFHAHTITHVIHLAYLMDPQHDTTFEYDVDVNGTKNLLNHAITQRSVQQIIEFSSTSIYGAHVNEPVWYTEESATRPRDYEYAKNKKIIEKYIDTLSTEKKIVIVRMCTAVGPQYYKKGGVVTGVTKAPFLTRLGGHDTLLQFIHEDDLTALVEKIVTDKTIEGVYNLTPDSFTSISRLARTYHKRTVYVPYALFYWLMKFLWSLRLPVLAPPTIKLMTYGIVASPKKLMDRYTYSFRYSSHDAFTKAVEQRKNNGTL